MFIYLCPNIFDASIFASKYGAFLPPWNFSSSKMRVFLPFFLSLCSARILIAVEMCLCRYKWAKSEIFIRELYAKFQEKGVTPDVIQFAEEVILPAEMLENGDLLLEPPMSFAGLASDIRPVRLRSTVFLQIKNSSFWKKRLTTMLQYCSTMLWHPFRSKITSKLLTWSARKLQSTQLRSENSISPGLHTPQMSKNWASLLILNSPRQKSSVRKINNNACDSFYF